MMRQQSLKSGGPVSGENEIDGEQCGFVLTSIVKDFRHLETAQRLQHHQCISRSAARAADQPLTAAVFVASRGVGQTVDSSSSSSDEEEAAEGEEDGSDAEVAEAQAQWGVGALAANPAERIPDGADLNRPLCVPLSIAPGLDASWGCC